MSIESGKQEMAEFGRRETSLQVSTSSPTSTGFGQGTLLFGHAIRVSALQASVYLDIWTSNICIDVDQHTSFIFPRKEGGVLQEKGILVWLYAFSSVDRL